MMMKGNKVMLLLVVLAVLIGVYFIAKYSGNQGRSTSFRSELVEIDSDQVTKIELFSPSDSTILKKEGDQWYVDDKKADESSVKSMLSTLQQIKPSRLASRSEDTWKDFQVDESGTRVVAFQDGDKVLDIILGRFNVEGQRSFYSYVRLQDESDVYVAKDFMKMSINTGANAYRNDDILKVEKDSLSGIAFNYPDSGFVLSRGDAGWSIGQDSADSTAVAKYLQGVRSVTSRNFAENNGVETLYDVAFQQKNGEDIQVAFHADGGISSSSNPDEFWEDQALRDKVCKSRSYFLGE
ncbi:MAG: DUF4340 domain-containing protein [Marinoscillum sp.]